MALSSAFALFEVGLRVDMQESVFQFNPNTLLQKGFHFCCFFRFVSCLGCQCRHNLGCPQSLYHNLRALISGSASARPEFLLKQRIQSRRAARGSGHSLFEEVALQSSEKSASARNFVLPVLGTSLGHRSWAPPMDAPNGQVHASDADAKSDVFRAVTDLIGAAQHMHHDPASVGGVEVLIDRLKNLLHEEKHAYTLAHQNSDSRKKIESLHNLIQYLESQVDKARKVVQRSGVKHYLASVSSIVLGDEVTRIGHSMGSKLKSWLDQQGVRELSAILSHGSEDARMEAIISLKDMVEKGYDGTLQETILSCGLVERLAALLTPSAKASWNVQKASALVLCALLSFNKDIFLSLILMAKVIESLVKLMDKQPEQRVFFLVCFLNGFLSAGQTIIADEIHSQDGVVKIVRLLDHKSQRVKLAAMDCVFEMAYYGRMEVVQKMFEQGVIQKLTALHESSIFADKTIYAEKGLLLIKDRGTDLSSLNCDMKIPERVDESGERNVPHPFSNAVTRFALHFAVGTGLRKRERRALKQQFLKQIQEIMQDDTEVANITAEILWAP